MSGIFMALFVTGAQAPLEVVVESAVFSGNPLSDVGFAG